MKAFRSFQLAAFIILATGSVAAAQTVPSHVWSHGTTINLFAGMATAAANAGVTGGGAAGWEVTKVFGIEGLAEWLDRPTGEEGFNVSLNGHLNLTSARPIKPFLKAGVGFYRATFDGSAAEVPDFYKDRINEPDGAVGMRRTFTDPSLVVGGGMNVFVSRHWAIRPDVAVTIVRDHSASYTVTGVNVHAAYHFEDHSMAPSRPRK